MASAEAQRPAAEAARALVGGGEMGALLRAFDWSRTPLGPVDGWPPSLRSAVQLILESRYPMMVVWGQDLLQFYNDAYRPILGSSKHPAALGAPVAQSWPEAYDVIGPLFHGVLDSGQAVWFDDLLLPVDRDGFLEETHFGFSYSAIRDESGRVAGVLVTCQETTPQVLGERRLNTLRDLAARAAEARTADEACRIAAATLGAAGADLPFVLIYLLDDDGAGAHLAAASGAAIGSPIAPLVVSLDADTAGWPVGAVAATLEPAEVHGLEGRFGAFAVAREAPWDSPPWLAVPRAALVLPLARPGQQRAAGVLVAAVSPHLALDDRFRHFLDLVAGEVAAAVANARAYAEERRRAEALAELDRAKTAFFSNVSHEFRTPLTLLLGPLDEALGRAEGGPGAGQRALLDTARRNALRLLKLVNSLLEFSRIEAGRIQAAYEPTDLAALTAELASVFRSAIERAGLRLVVACPPLPRPVYVDRDMWEKIVLNLLANAFKHTFDGEIAVTLRQEGERVALAVRDSGVGIPAAELPRLFERFHRVQEARARTQEGTGIGLALVQELARLHSGTVTVESAEGLGSTFTVTLPLGSAHLPADRIRSARPLGSTAPGAAPFVEEALRWLPDAAPVEAVSAVCAATEPLGRDEPARGRVARILLADDNADMRAYVRRLLSGRHAVEAVADGEAALEAVRARPPDLVLADVMMPRLDGFALLRALRADPATRTIPIILLSARAGEESRIEGLGAGADDYLAKPFSARELLARVDARLELARARAEAQAAVEAERARLQQVLDVLPAGVSIADTAGRFVMSNRAARELVGFDFTGRPMPTGGPDAYEQYGARRPDGSPYPSAELPLQRSVLRRETVHGDRFSLRNRRTGQEVPVLANSAPLFDAEGRHVGGMVVTQDISAIQDLERQKDAFLSAASHDLQQPVAAIRGNAQLLLRRLRRDEPPDREWLRAGLARVEEATVRLGEQIAELLDLSRLQTGRPLDLRLAPADLAELARRAVAAYQEAGDGRTWRLAAPAGRLEAAVDAARLRRALDNLLANAAKFSPPGAEVVVTVGRATRAGGDWALLSVRDRGIGIPAADLPRVFERFFRAGNAAGRTVGSGIGLAGARQIVEQHGGSLSVESVEGEGSTFTIRLPLSLPA